MQKLVIGRLMVPLAAVLAATSLAPKISAAAASLEKETVLYSFCAQGGRNCTDGTFLFSGLIMDAAGRLYGTTQGGGAHHVGTVFELTPNVAKTKWTHTTLYSFCAHYPVCTDGAAPYAGLTMGASGRLYGTTYAGGASNGGTVFELTPNTAGTKWTETVLYSFCSLSGSISGTCVDGFRTPAGLTIDPAGHLYGTTDAGGAHYTGGTVFELTPNAAGTAWTEAVLYNFCSQGGARCTDGQSPIAGVIRDAAGHLYGTTEEGGAHGGGTVFELTPNADKTKWTHTILYNFCSTGDCTDGLYPGSALIIDAAGRLYGTTGSGGPDFLAGTVFELTPNAAKTKWTETVLHGFCSSKSSSNPCADGDGPASGNGSLAGLIMDASGHLYGTTQRGGQNDTGAVFELAPNAAKTTWTETVLYSFCPGGGCADGNAPEAGLIMDRSGHLYGTTLGGGAHAGGTVFELP